MSIRGPKSKPNKKSAIKSPLVTNEIDFRQGHADSVFMMDEDINGWSPEKPAIVYSKELSPKSYEKKFAHYEKAIDAIHDARCKVEQLDRISPTEPSNVQPAPAQTNGFQTGSFRPRKLFK